MKMTKYFKEIHTEDILNGYVYVEKMSQLQKLPMAYNIGYQTFISCGYET